MPSASFAQAPVLNMKSAASAGGRVGRAAGRRSPARRRAWPTVSASSASLTVGSDRRVRAVGGDVVDQRLGVLQVLAEVRPVGVRRQLGVVGLGVDLRGARSLSGGTPASRARAMLIVGRSSGRPSRLLRRVSVTNSSSSLPTWSDEPMTMRAGGLLGRVLRRVSGRVWPLLKYSGGLRNAVSSGSELSCFVPFGVDVLARDVVVEHRVPEAVDGVRELGRDGRVDVRGVDVERPDRRLHLARELLEDEVLVLHLGDEAGGLEQALAVAVARRRVRPPSASARHCGERSATPSADVSRRRGVCLMSSTSRSCSEWKIWWIVVSAMFSLTRPSPAAKCVSSSSSS